MGTTLVSTVLTKVQNSLNDTAPSPRWSVTGLLIPYINDGMLELARLTRDAYVVRRAFQLKAGLTLQQGVLPGDTIEVLSVVRNMGTDGNSPGRTISEVGLREMDAVDRDWHMRAAHEPDNDIVNWIRDTEDFQSFYVYPKPSQSKQVWVEIKFKEVPPAVAATTDVIPTADKYRFQLQLYVAGSALLQDVEFGNQPRGVQYLNLFYSSLGAQPPARAA